MKDKLAIFDMDGTLFDTKRANFEAYRYAVEKAGFICRVDQEHFVQKCFGKNYRDFLQNEFSLSKEYIEEIHRIKCGAYSKLAQQYVREYPFMFQMISVLKSEYYIALLTTASHQNTYDLLELFDKRKIFDCIVTAEDVKHLKPDPEGIQIIMDHFGISSEKTLFFDDGKACVLAASKMGVAAFQVIV